MSRRRESGTVSLTFAGIALGDLLELAEARVRFCARQVRKATRAADAGDEIADLNRLRLDLSDARGYRKGLARALREIQQRRTLLIREDSRK